MAFTGLLLIGSLYVSTHSILAIYLNFGCPYLLFAKASSFFLCKQRVHAVLAEYHLGSWVDIRNGLENVAWANNPVTSPSTSSPTPVVSGPMRITTATHGASKILSHFVLHYHFYFPFH